MKRYTNGSRKRLALGTIAAMSVATAGCEAPVAQPLPLPDDPVQFSSPAECIAAGYETIACEDSYKAALAQHQADAPRYDLRDNCEEEWGAGNCRESGGGSNSFFAPFLTGYLLSSALRGPNSGYYRYGGYYGSPIYRSRTGTVQLAPSGRNRIGTGGSNSITRVATTPVTAPRPANVNTRTVSRSGFGGSMGSRGSFGG